MLETVTQGFRNATERLGGIRELTGDNVDEALQDVRRSLLEADVDFKVAKEFLAKVKERALGEKVKTRAKDAQGNTIRVTPGQHFVRICQEELALLMGPVDPSLAKKDGATSVMLVGLQGVGKTTVAAKLARHFQKRGMRPMLVAADVYRPAAVEQLKTLGASIDVPVHVGEEGELPPSICAKARARAKNDGRNAIIYDTAGRLAIDEALMTELQKIHTDVDPANVLLVCDSLMGRDAVNVAEAFSEKLDLDGVVLTKLDGDARGGAALAIKAVTGVPIKFLGTGETVDRLEEFRPEGLASRILGMGDIVGLVQDFEEVVDEQEAEQAEEDAERILKGNFGLDDLVNQLRMVQRLGPLRDVMAKMPGFGQLADQVDERELKRVEAMICSMTPQEKKDPDVIDRSRASRIARGCGRNQKDVHELVKRFRQMREMMANLGAPGGMLSRMPGMGQLAGAGAGGMDPTQMLAGGGGFGAPRPPVQRKGQQAKNKRKRKQQKKDRRKGRKR